MLALLLAAPRSSAADNAGSDTHRQFVVGINQDLVWTDDAELDASITVLKESGATHVRIPLRWTTVEPKRGQWDFAKVDRVVHKLRGAQIGILADLSSFPGWENETEGRTVEGWYDTYPPKDDTNWATYVRTVVRRYKKDIKLWEVWNEENGVDFWRPLPDAKRYVQLLKVTYKECKAADRKCTVVLGGLQMNGVVANPWSPVKTTDFLQAIYDSDGKPYFDCVNIHPYVLPSKEEGARYMRRLVGETIGVVKRNGDEKKPIWVTEIGCGTNETYTREAQAKLLGESYDVLARMPQVAAVYWFCLRDYKQAITGPEASMGIVTDRFERKPSFDAFRRSADKYGVGQK